MAKLLDGRDLSRIIREGMSDAIEDFVEKTGHRPELSVILASDDPASRIYVDKKLKACTEVGIRSTLLAYDPACSWHGCKSAEDFVRMMLKSHPVVDGPRWAPLKVADAVLVQLPIAGMSDPSSIFDLIPPDKDVDVLNPVNAGLLMQGRPRFKSCTPNGIMLLLEMNGIDVLGKTVCIINDSNIVGRPLAMLMTMAGATVTICHKRTEPEDLKYASYDADIVVVAVGIPGFLKPEMVHPGAIVIDVGINRLPDGRVVGDVEFDSVAERAAWITKVPGGVGPMTITALLANVFEAAKARNSFTDTHLTTKMSVNRVAS